MVQQQLSERSIFLEAIDIDGPAERAAYLDRACAGDADLRARIDGLLRAHERPQEVLDAAALTTTEGASPEPAERPGAFIDQYKLLEQIGEGGFGIVFMAEQTEPVRRKVALKVLKPGMDMRQVIARFEAERQALALMDHANIAQVFDGGKTESGRPYFVMELVKGIPITEFCEQNQLALRQRLDLFVSVCQAVQHAHQKGIIHRDLKPSNVLVTLHDGSPHVKVIDFGVAKATGQQLTDKTLFTNFAQMVGTPLYMSPEQAALSGLDVDTRSDIYSLGVLLYELLTGTTPFDGERFKEVGYDEMRRIIREEEPPRPSMRISTLRMATTLQAPQGPAGTKRLRRLCRGELDWIVMRCLEKDRNRRYETASALAADLQRYLNDEPVQACPPSAWYRLRKFGRRNKAALAIVGLVLLFLLALGVTLGWAARERTTRRQILEQQVAGALKESEDLYRAERLPQAFAALKEAEGLLAAAGGDGGPLGERVRQWRLDLEMVERLQDIRMRQSDQRGRLYKINEADPDYADAFRTYGINVEALEPTEAARRIATRAIKPNLIAGLDHWLQIRKEIIKAPDASWRPLLLVARAADDDDYRNQIRDALLARDGTALIRLTQVEHLSELPVVTALYAADVLRWNHQTDQALELLQRLQRRRPGDFWVNWQLAINLALRGRIHYDEAIRFFSTALAARPANVELHLTIGDLFYENGHFEQAIAEYREAIAQKPDFAEPHYKLAIVFYERHRNDDSISELRQAIAVDPEFAAAHLELGLALRRKGQFSEALTSLRRGHELGSTLPNWKHRSPEMIRDCERLMALEGELSDYLSGKRKPANLNERLLLAQLCEIHQTGYAAAARWFGEVIAATPAFNGDRPTPARYRAARVAALAAAEKRDTPDDSERASSRRLARDWLRAELAAERKVLDNRPIETNFICHDLRHWQQDTAFAAVRDDLEALPAAERAEWRDFWQDVARLEKTAALRAGGSRP
jgi:serine/threonine protein kinase/Flp pilus assembly protein TadD